MGRGLALKIAENRAKSSKTRPILPTPLPCAAHEMLRTWGSFSGANRIAADACGFPTNDAVTGLSVGWVIIPRGELVSVVRKMRTD